MRLLILALIRRRVDLTKSGSKTLWLASLELESFLPQAPAPRDAPQPAGPPHPWQPFLRAALPAAALGLPGAAARARRHRAPAARRGVWAFVYSNSTLERFLF